MGTYLSDPTLRITLDRLARASQRDDADVDHELARAVDALRGIPAGMLLDRLWAVAGRTPARRQAALMIVGELIDNEEVARALDGLYDSLDGASRNVVLESIGRGPPTAWSKRIGRIIQTETSPEHRSAALAAAGRIGDPVNLPLLLAAASEQPPNIAAVSALRRFTSPLVIEALRRVLHGCDDPYVRVLAAWGLAKAGDAAGAGYLINSMLTFPSDTAELPPGLLPARTAQAIADVYGLPFEWSTEGAMAIRRWCEANS